MMRHRLMLAAAVSFGLVGCALRPAGFVGLPTTTAGATSAEATAPVSEPAAATQNGTLQLSIRWPERPSSYQTAQIPITTNTITVNVASGSTVLGQTAISRVDGQTTATATMSLRAGNNLSVEVLAFRETKPVPDTAQPIARWTGNVNIQPSRKSTLPTVSLGPLFVPTITGLSSNVGVTGDDVTIAGTNFPTDTSIPLVVDFNGILSDEVTRLSATSLKAKLPPNVQTGRVVVKADGVASTATNWVLWVPSSLQLSSVKENWDPSPTGDRLLMFGHTMQFTGTPTWSFQMGDSINYGTPPVPSWTLSNPNAGSIDGTGLLTASRSYETTNVWASLGSLNSATQSVKLVADAPVISSLTPANGGLGSGAPGDPQTVVTVNGSGFGNDANSTLRVFLGATEITDVTQVSDTQLRFTLPSSGVRTGQVKVLSYSVTSANKPTFQVIQNLNVTPTGITLSLPLGGTQQYSVSATDTENNPVTSPNVTWSVNSPAATISPTGLITALDYGTCYPMARSGAVTTWGATALIDYTYNVQSGNGYMTNTVLGRTTSTYYSQSFTLSGSKTFKSVDAGIMPDSNAPLDLEIRADNGSGLPANGIPIKSMSATLNGSLPGHVYAFPQSVTLAAGTYHLIFKIPAGQNHYAYFFTGGGTGAAEQSDDGGVTWKAIDALQPYYSPNALFFRLGE